MWRTVEIQCQRNILRQVAIRILRRYVLLVVVTHRGAGSLGFRGVCQCSLNFRSHIASRCVRDRQVLVVATGIERREHGKNRLAALQGDGNLILSHAERRQQPDQGREQRTSQSQTQEALHRNAMAMCRAETTLKCNSYPQKRQQPATIPPTFYAIVSCRQPNAGLIVDAKSFHRRSRWQARHSQTPTHLISDGHISYLES